MSRLDQLTREDIAFIQTRARYAAWRSPWLVDEIVGRVCLDLVRRPYLLDGHPFSQAVNMLVKSRLLDLVKQHQQLPAGIMAAEFEHRVPPSSLDADEAEWLELEEWLTDVVRDSLPSTDPLRRRSRSGQRGPAVDPAKAARVAVAVARFSSGKSRADIAADMGISKHTVAREMSRVRNALIASQSK